MYNINPQPCGNWSCFSFYLLTINSFLTFSMIALSKLENSLLIFLCVPFNFSLFNKNQAFNPGAWATTELKAFNFNDFFCEEILQYPEIAGSCPVCIWEDILWWCFQEFCLFSSFLFSSKVCGFYPHTMSCGCIIFMFKEFSKTKFGLGIIKT